MFTHEPRMPHLRLGSYSHCSISNRNGNILRLIVRIRAYRKGCSQSRQSSLEETGSWHPGASGIRKCLLFSRLCQCSTCIEKGVRPSLLPGEKGLELERALRGQPLTDAGLVHLKGLKNLQRLDLSATQVTTAGVEDLQSALPECKISK